MLRRCRLLRNAVSNGSGSFGNSSSNSAVASSGSSSNSLTTSTETGIVAAGDKSPASTAATSLRGASSIRGVSDGTPPTLAPPVSISTTHHNLPDLVSTQMDRLEKRKKKLFDDMIVFEGGSVDDNETLGDRMLFRNFVHFGLYHNKWGLYPKMFRKYRDRVTSGFFDPVPFGSLLSEADYRHYYGKLNEEMPTFITPPQLFAPYYGWVFAEYVIGVYRAKFSPTEPLVIYDIGAGTGAFAEHFLNYLADFHPQLYEITEYHLVEMSPNLVALQRNRMIHHYHRSRIHNISILNWREQEQRRCFVIAIELLSQMPHDVVTWLKDGSSYERWIHCPQKDNLSGATERMLQLKDPAILRYLRYLNWMREDTFHALKVLCQTGGRENIDPLRHEILEPVMWDSSTTILSKVLAVHNPFRTMYIPTASMMMMEVLAEYFPRHHALFVDTNHVEHGLGGYNSPVVQGKLRVSKNLYLRRVSQNFLENIGQVDITFPTDFEALQTVYKAICGNEKEIMCMSHPDFWKTFGGEKTSIFTARSGYNPLVQDFSTYQVLSSHHSPDE